MGTLTSSCHMSYLVAIAANWFPVGLLPPALGFSSALRHLPAVISVSVSSVPRRRPTAHPVLPFCYFRARVQHAPVGTGTCHPLPQVSFFCPRGGQSAWPAISIHSTIVLGIPLVLDDIPLVLDGDGMSLFAGPLCEFQPGWLQLSRLEFRWC